MELRQLRYFVKMVELGNMTRAAHELHVAQPALSQQLANLEAGLGVRLLDRSLKGVSPTSAGVLFYKHAKAVLRQVADSELAMQAERDSPSGEITVAMPASSARLIAVPLLRRLLADHPGIRLRLVEVPSANIPTLLSRAEVDIAIAADVPPTKAFDFKPMLSEKLFAILPNSTEFGEASMTLRQLAQFPLLLPQQSNGIRSRLDVAFARQKLDYQLLAEINVTNLLALAVRDGLGLSVLPWSAVHEYSRARQLRVVPLVKPSISRELLLCTAEGLDTSAAAQVVMASIKQVCIDLAAAGSWKGAIGVGSALRSSIRSATGRKSNP